MSEYSNFNENGVSKQLTSTSLERGLNNCHKKLLNLIVFLLSRYEKEYMLHTLYHHESGYVDYKRTVLEHFDLVTERKLYIPDNLDIFDTIKYLESLCDKQESFIISAYSNLYEEFSHDCLRLFCKRDNVAYLSTLGQWHTLCFIANHDSAFRKVIMQLLLFSEIYDFSACQFEESNMEELAQAVESMDIDSYSLIPNPRIYPKKLILVQTKNVK